MHYVRICLNKENSKFQKQNQLSFEKTGFVFLAVVNRLNDALQSLLTINCYPSLKRKVNINFNLQN